MDLPQLGHSSAIASVSDHVVGFNDEITTTSEQAVEAVNTMVDRIADGGSVAVH